MIDPLPGPEPVNRRRWWSLLLIIGPYPALIGLLSFAFHHDNQPALGHNVADFFRVFSVEITWFGAFFALAWLIARATRDDLLLRWRPGWWVVPLGVGYSIALRIVVAVIGLFIGVMMAVVLIAFKVVKPDQIAKFITSHQPKVETLVDAGLLARDPVYFWLVITLGSFVLAGLREELWRSAFLGGLRKLWPQWFGSRAGEIRAVAIGAIIFGAGHAMQGGLAVVLTALLGFGLGVIIVVHRSIWPAVIAHGMFDATSFALLMLLRDKLPH